MLMLVSVYVKEHTYEKEQLCRIYVEIYSMDGNDIITHYYVWKDLLMIYEHWVKRSFCTQNIRKQLFVPYILETHAVLISGYIEEWHYFCGY